METGRRLFDFKPKVHFKDRFTTHAKRQIELRKLRTLNEYGHKLDSEKLPDCLCGRPETVKHYIEECENYEEIRERCRLDLSQLAYRPF